MKTFKLDRLNESLTLSTLEAIASAMELAGYPPLGYTLSIDYDEEPDGVHIVATSDRDTLELFEFLSSTNQVDEDSADCIVQFMEHMDAKLLRYMKYMLVGTYQTVEDVAVSQYRQTVIEELASSLPKGEAIDLLKSIPLDRKEITLRHGTNLEQAGAYVFDWSLAP